MRLLLRTPATVLVLPRAPGSWVMTESLAQAAGDLDGGPRPSDPTTTTSAQCRGEALDIPVAVARCLSRSSVTLTLAPVLHFPAAHRPVAALPRSRPHRGSVGAPRRLRCRPHPPTPTFSGPVTPPPRAPQQVSERGYCSEAADAPKPAAAPFPPTAGVPQGLAPMRRSAGGSEFPARGRARPTLTRPPRRPPPQATHPEVRAPSLQERPSRAVATDLVKCSKGIDHAGFVINHRTRDYCPYEPEILQAMFRLIDSHFASRPSATPTQTRCRCGTT